MKLKSCFSALFVFIVLLVSMPLYCSSQRFIATPVYNKSDLVRVDTLFVNNKPNVVYTLIDGYWICNETGVEFMSQKFYEKWKKKNRIRN